MALRVHKVFKETKVLLVQPVLMAQMVQLVPPVHKVFKETKVLLVLLVQTVLMA